MKPIRLLILLLAAVPLSMAAATWTTIDYPGAVSTVATAINNVGQVVGYYTTSQTGPPQGFLLSGGTFTSIDYNGADYTWLWGINDSGQIVGDSYDIDGTSHAFLLDGGAFTTIDYPGTRHTAVTGINNAGDVVGSYSLPGHPEYGFEMSGGHFTTINAPGIESTSLLGINNLGIILGFGLDAFVYDGTKFLKIVAPGSYGLGGLNDRNEIVGWVSVNSDTVGDLRIHGQHILLRFPGAKTTACYGINNNDDIVGYYLDNTTAHGFLRTR